MTEVTAPSQSHDKPLGGVLVVSLEQAVAAPLATRHLADLGARVIKIERPEGDFARRYDESVHGQSSHFIWLNHGKESLSLDIKSEQGGAVLRDLLARADVLVSNLAPGALDRLGLGVADLEMINPQLLHCAISGYGPGSTWETRKAYDLILQCETGLTSITGTAKNSAKVGLSIVDISAGMYAVTSILAALYSIRAGAKPSPISISLFDSITEWMSAPILFTRYSGNQPARVGERHATIAPYGPFACADGKVVTIAVQNEREWRILCESVLEEQSLFDDERFTGNALRVRNRVALEKEIDRLIGQQNSDELSKRLDTFKIANGHVNDVAQFLDHPVLDERKRWKKIDTPAGEVEVIRTPFDVGDDTPARSAVPAVGEHTESILAELGYLRKEQV